MRVLLFGPPRLEAAGVPRKIKRRKVAALLAYLAMAGRPQSRDELAELLYPHLDRERAYADLRQCLSYLRSEVGEGLLEATPHSIALATGRGLSLDVSEFRSHVSKAHGAMELHHLRAAVGLYHGDFLGGFFLRDSPGFEEWQSALAEELHGELCSALARLHDLHVRRGELAQAVDCARSIVGLDHLDEAAQRRLMRTLAAAGRKQEAIRQFEAFRALLARELAADPEEETRELLAGIRGAQRQVASLGVLPFDNLSEDPEQTYFCDGLTEDLTTALTAIPGLKIAARSAMFAFKGQSPDPRRLGRDLLLTHILEGSIRKAGTRIRINVRLLDAGTGDNLWAEKFDRELTGVFEIQDDIVRLVVTELEVQLAEGEQARLWRASTKSSEAYDLFLRARYCIVNPESFLRGSALLDQALALDPDFTAALCWQGWICILQARLGWIGDPQGALRKASLAFERALRLDERCADAHGGRGGILFLQKRFEEAGKEYELALSLGPVLEGTHLVCAAYYTWKKDHARALWAVQRAKELTRLPSSQAYAWEIVCLRNLGRLEEALAVSRRALELFPNGLDIVVNHANVCRLLKLQQELEAALKRMLELQPNFSAERWVESTGIFTQEEQARYAAELHQAGFPP